MAICAVRVRRPAEQAYGIWGALPASMRGMSVSPTARPNPSTSEENSVFFASGRTKNHIKSIRVKPSARPPGRSRSRRGASPAESSSTMVGRIRTASIRAALNQQKPVPPTVSRTRGVSRKTAANPYTTVGMAVMIRTRNPTMLRAERANPDCPFTGQNSQQHSTSPNGQPMHSADSARTRLPAIIA